MHINKEIITRIIFITIFIGFSLRIIIPILFDKMKGKTLGLSNSTDDLDYMIKRQREILKSQYNLVSPMQTNDTTSSKNTSSSKEIGELKNELSWGGTKISKDLKNKLTQSFGHQFGDNKLNAFLNLIDRKNYLAYLDSNNSKIDKEAITNFLASLFILLVIIDEIKEKNLSFTERCAKKLNLNPSELALSVQLKVLMLNSESKIKEEKIYSSQLILSQVSEETIMKSVEKIVKMETNLWKKSISMIFEELSLYLNYASILTPLEPLKNKNDLDTAFRNFGESTPATIEEVKKKYKKLALIYHPDKIIPQKLPKGIEDKALQKFNIIQESFRVISTRK